ncbi:hypothetical protein GYMLUDRAFT_67201 [Collybiopsis luxurians FD-317 M1]|nr:hypothetical protein GYMLUDRAFT_67201 [Collybiopsis luxurians FD-317 M1]
MTTSIQASFIGAFLSTFFYGFYLSDAFRLSTALLRRYKRQHPRPAYLLLTHAVLFLLVNIRCSTVLVRVLVALFNQASDGTISESPIWSKPSLLANITLYLAILVSDAFLCYRTYTVWSQSLKIIAIPVLLLLSDLASMIYLIKIMANSNTPNYFDSVNRATKYIIIVTLIFNVLNSALIAYRIWSVRRRSGSIRRQEDMLGNFLSIVVESAALYSALLITYIIFLSMDSFLIFIFIDIQAPVIGIVFSKIIMTVANRKAFCDTGDATTTDITFRHSSSDPDPPPTGVEMSRVINSHRGTCQLSAQRHGKLVVAASNLESAISRDS